VDGTYVLSSWVFHALMSVTCSQPPDREQHAETWQFAGNRFAFTLDVGTTSPVQYERSGTFTVSGHTMSATPTCGPWLPDYVFSVNGPMLTICYAFPLPPEYSCSTLVRQ
jgi:hypothetical protein